MRNFDWGFRATHILGGIIEALIVLVSVAVLVGLVFLLVRFLLVATRAAQLYVAQHEPPRPSAPLAPTPAPAPAPAAASAASTAATDATKPQPAAAPKKPTRPKTPPSA